MAVPQPLLFSYQRTGLEQHAWRKDDSRNDKCAQVTICEQISKNRCCKCHTAHSSALRFAVVCLASVLYTEPLNDGACAAIARNELFDVFKSAPTTPPSQLATKCVRVNVLHKHVCVLNSQVLDREWGSSQFRENRIETNCSHRENESV